MTSQAQTLQRQAAPASDFSKMIQEVKTNTRKLFSSKKPEPSYPKLPKVDESAETNIKNLYAIGEVAGTPLVKLGLNEGHDLVMRIAPELKANEPQDDHYDLVIVGSGSSGLGAAAAAKETGLKAVVLEAAHFANTIYTMTKGKWIFAEPDDVECRSSMYLEECTRETLLEQWTAQVAEKGLDVRTHEKVQDIQRKGDHLEVVSTRETYKARKVILAIGKSGNPRKAGVPGEDQYGDRIDHLLIDPDKHNDQDIFIYGGGDVALEAALTLCHNNRVTLVTIDQEFTYPKKRNIDAVMERVAEGKIALHMHSFLKEIKQDEVVFSKDGPDGPKLTVKADHVFEMIGAELPLGFFKKIGIQMAESWNPKRWTILAVVFVFIYSLYALKSYGKGIVAWPYESLITPETYDAWIQAIFKVTFAPFGWLFSQEAYANIMSDRGFQQGYLYSGLYTILMTVFGYEAMVRWRNIARDKRYQTYRYISLMSFQIGFFLIVNVIAVQALSVKYAWRAWGLYQPFPLFFNTFFWWYEGDPVTIMAFFIGAGLLGTFVIIPWMARNHGKRFCTWICGCGGLAETLGDRWRHLSPKGERSRLWEFQNVVILAASFIIGIVVVGAFKTDGSNGWWRTYNYLVDFWLVAVIPIALYPFYGGKVWCRYWCPLASYNGLLSKWYGRLKIVANDKCISCTQCSKYCQVGVDVMHFAKNQEPFDNSNSACIHCGICIDVCPMDVLSFETSDGRASDINKSMAV